MIENAIAQSLTKHLFSEPETAVYAILDGASVPDLPQLLWEHEPENICLYRGELEPDVAEVAPYLVKLGQDHAFTKLVFEKGWGEHWGIFATTPVDVNLRDLRKHFRTFLMVYSPDNKGIYFRYYDPRVLRVYLPTCNAEELNYVYGPVNCYYVEDEDPSNMLRLSQDIENVHIEKMKLTQ